MSYINKAKCKKFLLEYASANRSHKFTRVSKDTLESIDLATIRIMTKLILSLPSKGKTIIWKGL